jgi:pimeloyl-ACP methyl ester carboxylesterase
MIHFFEKGVGAPLVLIHGFCETSQMWTSFAEELSQEFRVICPDLPGFGNSPIESDQITLEEIASSLENWMLDQQFENPIVIGHSLGGYVTLALLERMGEKIKAIGLFHSTSFADDLEKKEMRDRTVTFLQKHGVDKFVTTFVPQLFPDSKKVALEAEINEAISQAKKSSLNGLIAFSRAMRDRIDRSECVRKFKGPKLFIAGTLDGAVKIEASRAQQELFTTYHELAETGHMGMIERKEETIELVRQFCRSAVK